MAGYRLTHAAQADILAILAWSDEQFGEEARRRYEVLIARAIRDAASRDNDIGHTPRPEMGDGVFSWHLAQSLTHAPGQTVRRPRHFLICRRDGDVLVIGRVVHDAMELRRNVDPDQPWDQVFAAVRLTGRQLSGISGPPQTVNETFDIDSGKWAAMFSS